MAGPASRPGSRNTWSRPSAPGGELSRRPLQLLALQALALPEFTRNQVDARLRGHLKGRVDQGLISTATATARARRGILNGLVTVLSRSHGLACAALIALSLVMFLPGFTALPPMDRDEPRFAQASKQMLETGNFVSIRFQEEARNKKPVGIYWLQSATVALAESLGIDSARSTIWIYRIPSLIGAVAAVLLTYWAGYVWLESRYAFMAAALMSATLLLGVEARLAKTDAVLTATIVAAMGALARLHAMRDSKTAASASPSFVLWLAIGVSVLIKGPIVLMVAGVASVALSIKDRSGRWLRQACDLRAIAVALIIVAPWFVAIALDTHGAFFRDAVEGDMLGKVAAAREAHGAPPGTYLLGSLVTLWPIAPLALIAAPAIWRARGDDAVLFLLAWLVPSWLVFEAVPTKLPHYVLPLYPAIALLVARAAERGLLLADAPWKRFAFALLPLPAGIVALAIPYVTLLYGDRADLSGALIATLATLGAGFAAIAFARKRVEQGCAVLLVAAWLLFVGVYQFAIPRLQAVNVSPRLAFLIGKSPCVPQALASAGYNEPSLVFLTRTDLRLTNGADAARFLALPGCRAAFVDIRQEGEFTKSLAAISKTPNLLGRVLGVDLNGGRHLDIGVYANGG
ncbi:MAG: glycosyltransferase family 39 protein [Hyphomicrobiales bacterium]|nr:glycosyltransferase family 39 protein [Hyphomicrobiales bacterium]